ncbi:hypothetical protein BC829DRAFT_420573 [Chytridium lagenaria]|nr:hypothetical protein BC829DRAFT_420573 [Chytridium lagenaria]
MTSPNRVNATNPDDAKERRGSAVRDAAAKMGKASLHSGVIMSMLNLVLQNSSDLCTTTSRASVNDLAVGIQNQVGALLRSEMYNLITPATIFTGIISYYNYEELLRFMFNEIRLNTAVQELFYIDDATGNFLSAWRPRNMPPGTIATTFFNTNPALYSCPLCFSSPQLNGSKVRHQFTINPNFTIGSLIARFTFTPDFRDRPWFFQARTMELGSAVWANAWMDPVNFAQRGAALTAGSPVVINGTFRGGFGANMRTQELNENLKSFNLTKNGFVYVMGTNGIMIGSSINETLVITVQNTSLKPYIRNFFLTYHIACLVPK